MCLEKIQTHMPGSEHTRRNRARETADRGSPQSRKDAPASPQRCCLLVIKWSTRSFIGLTTKRFFGASCKPTISKPSAKQRKTGEKIHQKLIINVFPGCHPTCPLLGGYRNMGLFAARRYRNANWSWTAHSVEQLPGWRQASFDIAMTRHRQHHRLSPKKQGEVPPDGTPNSSPFMGLQDDAFLRLVVQPQYMLRGICRRRF